MTAALDDLTIVVDETHEDRVCEIEFYDEQPLKCDNAATIGVQWVCSCIAYYCHGHHAALVVLDTDEGYGVICPRDGHRNNRIVRTWPVTR